MFDGPQRAIRCAMAIRDAVQSLGIQVRAGLHTGECEVRGDDIGGIAVHIGARVSALAGRPPASITEIEKRENAAAYGYTGSLKDVEYDHLVPLELGGDPNDPRNLWIEPGASPNPKDGVESRLHELVCEGRVPLALAQEAIATDWTTALDAVR